MRKLTNQRGFHLLEVLIVLAVVTVIGMIGWKVFTKDVTEDTLHNSSDAAATPSDYNSVATFDLAESEKSTWEITGEGTWMDLGGKPPACPEPFTLASPTDLSKATALLVPGQTRKGTFAGQGGNYKPHGGFRFDTSKPGDIKVYSPIDGYVTKGSRYLVDGEIQYTFDIVHPCGYMARLGHLRKLTSAFEEIAEKFPAAEELNSRTERIEPQKLIKAGEQIATAVGLETTTNTFFDLGIYDLRATNKAAGSPAYKQQHADAKDTAWHAVCWLNMFGEKESAAIAALPAADSESGAKSDYCE